MTENGNETVAETVAGGGRALAVREQAPLERAARERWSPYQRELIRKTVARDANDAEFEMFLELALRYRLDPFARQIFCAKMRGEDGGGGTVAIMVGRDGFLKIANDTDEFEGMQGDCVYEEDEFVKEETPKGPSVTHTVKTPAARGNLVGAWAIVHRRGRFPTYFFAYRDQYRPTSERKLKYSPWGAQEDVMMLKCAQSTGLRLAFNITGLIGAEEASAKVVDAVTTADIDYGDDAWLAARIADLVEAANAVRPSAFLPGRVRLMVNGKTEGERREFAAQLEEFIVKNGGEVPEPPPDPEPDPEPPGPEQPQADEAEWEPVKEETKFEPPASVREQAERGQAGESDPQGPLPLEGEES